MRIIFLVSIVVFLISGCASGPSVVKGPKGQESLVRISQDLNVQAGDKVEVLKRTCHEVPRGGKIEGTRNICKQNAVGAGQILRLNSSDEAVVSSFGGLILEPGMIIKKIE